MSVDEPVRAQWKSEAGWEVGGWVGVLIAGVCLLAADGFPLIVMCDMLQPIALWDRNTLPCGGFSHTEILMELIFCCLLFAAVVISFVFLWHYSFTTLLLKANISNPSLKHYPPILKSTKAVWTDLCCGALCTSADEGSTGWWHAAYSFLHVGRFVIGSMKV